MGSIWSQTCSIGRRPPLRGHLKTQAAVVGAGMAGVLTAYALQQAGLSVVVLEADRIAGGQTQNTTAKITSQHGLIYSRLIQSFGEETARRYAKANQDAVRAYQDLIDVQGISCDWEERCAYLYGPDVTVLQEEAEAARRLGLPEEIIDRAAARLDAENVRFEDVLTKLDQQRQEMEKDRAEARRLKLEMEQSAGKAREYRKRLEEERSKVVEKAQAEARAIIQEARDASDLALSELKELKKRQDLDWQQVNDGRAEARRLLNEAERSIGGAAQEPEAPPPTRPARAGDTVELVSMGTRASVLSVNKDGTLQLQAGILKITAKQDEVRVVEGETQSQKEARRIVQRAQHTLRAAAAPSEIDLRGMMTDEAIAVLDRFLDTAMMGKLESVTIIHGKGTGAVRKAVREHLKRSRYIKSFRPGRYGEGEDGVTVAELR